jgi:NAD(P)-dependent dehydrogenase (short-subunit alcohol dehydrogenase family)
MGRVAAMNSQISNTADRPLAIVTGGSRGLGYVVAKELSRLGNRVLIVSKDPERASKSASEIGCEFETVDFQDLDATQIKFQEIAGKYGTAKILVLAHGVMSEKMSKTLRTTTQEWRRVMAINLDSVFIAINTIAPAMAESRDGRVIIFTACLGRMSGPGNAGGLAPYRISKAGVNALVRNLAHETGQGGRGFLVDATCPNHSRTDMGGPDAPRSAEEGAATAIWLATRNFESGKDQTGLFWEDQQIIPW